MPTPLVHAQPVPADREGLEHELTRQSWRLRTLTNPELRRMVWGRVDRLLDAWVEVDGE